MPSTDVRIDEVIGLLHQVRPKALERLRNENHTLQEVLKVGQTLGDPAKELLLLRAAQSALAEIVPWGETAIDACRKNLTTARRLELWGALIATIGSVGCTAFAFVGDKEKSIFTAIISLVGNVCVVLGNYYRGSLMSGKLGLESSYQTLLQCMPELRFIQPQLKELLEHDGASASHQDIKALTDRAQILCKEVYQASKQVPSVI